MMKNIILILTLTFITVGFSACSEDSGSTQEVPAVLEIPITMQCVSSPTAADIDAYETLISADTIVKDEDNTTISTFTALDGEKKVCLVSGSAHIVR